MYPSCKCWHCCAGYPNLCTEKKPMNNATTQQSAPTHNARPGVWQQIITEVSKWPIPPAKVIEDMRARDQFGTEKYGTPLQSFNGRDALVDAYQEALDLCAYSYQHWEETGEMEDLYHKAIKITIRLRVKIFERTGK